MIEETATQTSEQRVGTLGNLPVQLTRLVGRDAALGELRSLVWRTRVLTLCGPGGAGMDGMKVGYVTYGQLSADRSNAVLLVPGTSSGRRWADDYVGPGKMYPAPCAAMSLSLSGAPFRESEQANAGLVPLNRAAWAFERSCR